MVHLEITSSVVRTEDYYMARFAAMASPCEVLIDTEDAEEAAAALEVAEGEARRIELKFSRYRTEGIVHRINSARGLPVEVDPETAALLDYAALCHEVSDGLFDITSGILRRLWKYDGTGRVPAARAVREVLRQVGWSRVRWQKPVLTMPAGMEIDLGGLGKEYAVDRTTALLSSRIRSAFLVNFGGDLFASGTRHDGRPWAVGIDDPGRSGESLLFRVELFRGGLATSGDARRFILWRGKRLGHILNPKTGWPVVDAPRSVTVLAPTCLEAGTLSTLAYLQGPGAEGYLRDQGVEFRVA